jgi:GNAT superfamily N-acetyltransferase
MGLQSHRLLGELDGRLAPLLNNTALPEGVRWLHAIAVRQEARGQGVGSELLERSVDGSSAWALLTSKENLLGWYADHGFSVAADRQIGEGVTTWLLVRPRSS